MKTHGTLKSQTREVILQTLPRCCRAGEGRAQRPHVLCRPFWYMRNPMRIGDRLLKRTLRRGGESVLLPQAQAKEPLSDGNANQLGEDGQEDPGSQPQWHLGTTLIRLYIEWFQSRWHKGPQVWRPICNPHLKDSLGSVQSSLKALLNHAKPCGGWLITSTRACCT